MALGYLLDPFIQIQNDNGTPIVGAKIYVYNADTTNLATTYNDFEGHLNTNPVITDDLGNATIVADDGIEYDVSVYDANDLLLFTKKYISIDKTSSAGGTTQVTAGYGISVEKVGNTFIVSVDTDLIATKDDLADKQDKLHAGANIEITEDNVINVVQRKEIVVQNPIKVERSPSRIKLYIDGDYTDQFKTKQNEVIIGGASANYISKITQTENGNVSADVGNFVAGANINIANNNGNLSVGVTDSIQLFGDNDLQITKQTADKGTIVDAAGVYVSNLTRDAYTDISKDHVHIRNTTDGAYADIETNSISLSNASGSVSMSLNNNPQIGLGSIVSGAQKSSIDIAAREHQYANERVFIKLQDTPDSTHINNLRLDTTDVQLTEFVQGQGSTVYSLKNACTPYSAGANINITNHVVSGKDWTSDITSAVSGKLDTSTFTAYSAAHASDDVTPYSAGTGISVASHQVSVDSTIATKNELSRLAQIDKTYTVTHTVASDEAHWICFDIKQCFRDYRTYIYNTIPNMFDYILSPVIMYIGGTFNANISNNGFCYVGIRPVGVLPVAEPAATQVVYMTKISNSDFSPKPTEYGTGAFYTFAVENSNDIMDIMPGMSNVWFDLALVDSTQTIWHTGDTFTLTIRFICTASYRKAHV